MSQTLRLTRADVPDGSLFGVLSDIHIPHHDAPAVRIAVDVCEYAGVTHTIGLGDIADCGPASRHEEKRKQAVLDEGCLQESIAAGLWIYDWLRTRGPNRTFLVNGNHEGWVYNFVKKSAELKGSDPMKIMGLWGDGDGWRVLPPLGRIRLGSRCWEHLDGFFKSGNGGTNPGARIKSLAPDQTTSGGHLHRMFSHFWTSLDEEGVPRTRAAFGNGHLSNPEAHEDYAGSYQNWQQSFELTRVYYVDSKPRFSTTQVQIHRDKRNKPFCEYGGKVFR